MLELSGLQGALTREARRSKRRRECMNDRGFFAKIVKGELPEAPITKLLGSAVPRIR